MPGVSARFIKYVHEYIRERTDGHESHPYGLNIHPYILDGYFYPLPESSHYIILQHFSCVSQVSILLGKLKMLQKKIARDLDSKPNI